APATRAPALQATPPIFCGPRGTRRQSSGYNFPSTAQGFEKATHTPTLYSYSIGVQRDIGWSTIGDVAYVGSQSRHLLQTQNINLVPFGARFLPQNQDLTRAGSPLPDSFFRPYPGYGDIWFSRNVGTADTTAPAGKAQSSS